jgi:hypothetical protein
LLEGLLKAVALGLQFDQLLQEGVGPLLGQLRGAGLGRSLERNSFLGKMGVELADGGGEEEDVLILASSFGLERHQLVMQKFC